MEKVVLASKILFQPANGMRSTRSLDEIHNKYSLKFIFCFSNSITEGLLLANHYDDGSTFYFEKSQQSILKKVTPIYKTKNNM